MWHMNRAKLTATIRFPKATSDIVRSFKMGTKLKKKKILTFPDVVCSYIYGHFNH